MKTILIAILAGLSVVLVGVLGYQKITQPETTPIVVNQAFSCTAKTDCVLTYTGRESSCAPCDSADVSMQCVSPAEAERSQKKLIENQKKYGTACRRCSSPSQEFTCACQNGSCAKVAVNQPVTTTFDETTIQKPIVLEDESTIKTNIINKTGIKWEVINVDISNVLFVTLRRGYPQDEREGQLDKEGAEKTVKDFLILLKDELGISSVSDIVIDEVSLSNSIIVKYHQDYKNIPVYDSLGLISMTKYGEIYTLKHIWYSNVVAPIVPKITMAGVKQIALGQYKVGDIDFFEEPKLYVFSPNRLIWLVKIGEPVDKDVIMDALTGVVLSEQSNLTQ